MALYVSFQWDVIHTFHYHTCIASESRSKVTVMAEKTIRTHVVLPKELVAEVDELVGQRKRSAYIAAAVEARVAHDRFGKALKEAAGALANGGPPEWSTPEGTSAWVRKLRETDREIDYRDLNQDGEW